MHKFLIRLCYFTSVLLFIYCLIPSYSENKKFTKLLNIGSTYFKNAVPSLMLMEPYVIDNSLGYDGQFYCQIATDPSLKDPELIKAIDLPAYRAQRILIPFICYVAALGDGIKAIHIYSVINIIFWIFTSFVLLHFFPIRNFRDFIAWFFTLFSYGMVFSVTRSLVDLPAAFFIILAVYFFEKNFFNGGIVSLGLGVLTRETNLLSMGLFSFSDIKNRYFRIFLVCILPLILWFFYIKFIYESSNNVGTNLNLIPFSALMVRFTELVSLLLNDGFKSPARWAITDLFSIIVQCIFVVFLIVKQKKSFFSSPLNRLSILYFILVACSSYPIWEGFTPVTRAFLPLSFCFNVLIVRGNYHWMWLLLGNLTVVDGLRSLPYKIILTKVIGNLFS